MCKHSVYIVKQRISEPRFTKVFEPGDTMLAYQIEDSYNLLWINRGSPDNPSREFSRWFEFKENCHNCRRKESNYDREHR